ncbi:hypothetical protein C8R44DRAFT_661191, partial [Mycena epipterygia]
MKCLEEERDSLLNHLVDNAAVISPLRRMPPELLGEIFSWTLPSIDEGETMNLTDSPWVLTHISSRWRAVAHSTPSLWSLILVCFPAQPPYSLSMIKAHIQ